MRAVDVIRQKRDGLALSDEAIDFFVRGVTDGSIPDYQATALLMAVLWRGMSDEEAAWLTQAMTRSGDRADFSAIPGAKVDKHSTGGVGDKTSLILAPLAAACGVIVPMMSGRALGHTGGTVDKLESIPGLRLSLDLDEMKRALGKVGCVLIQQTSRIAPADKKLYALRDVTATVESVPLICASIMSKKIAEGIDGLVLDVKTGRAAFMKTVDDARRLATLMVTIGNKSGVRSEALLTAMNVPLGRAVGNSVEVIESIETLKGRGPRDLEDLSVALAARMVRMAGLEPTNAAAESRVRKALAAGAGVEKFREVIEHQGGDPKVIDDYNRLPTAPSREVITAPGGGFVADIDAMAIGRASMALGAGREKAEDAIDPAPGLWIKAHVGDRVSAGDPLVEILYRDKRRSAEAAGLIARAYSIEDAPPSPASLILEEIVQ
ncbi:MAG TPA: thymidine phosphorylase [Vicinamibacterales bacterium]|nr:thymidine phosphorylase [Vicinamibacterales bacterium]